MAHLVALGLEIKLVVLVRTDLDGNILNHLQTISLKAFSLFGIVGEQFYFTQIQFAQDACTHTIIALIGFETQIDIGCLLYTSRCV